MIVACPSCSARFKVADEKIGPLGAKVRCSKCQKVFGVQRDAAAPPRTPRAGPASPDLDLEPAAGRSPPPLGAVAAPDDPFAPAAAPAPPPLGGSPPPPDDPFATFHQASAATASPPALPRRPPPPPPTPPPAAFPSFEQAGTADLLAAPPAPPAPSHPAFDDGLALEEPTIRPPRPPPRPTEQAADGWLGELAGSELEGRPGDVPSFPDVIPDGAAGFDTASFSAPFPSASVSIQTGTVEQPAPRTALEEVSARRRAAVAAGPEAGQERGTRLRVALVDTLALAVLLLAALALAAVWRGGPSPAEALRPAGLLAVLTHQPAAGSFEAKDIQSAFYERRRGPPLLFVRGLVTSRAAAPTGPVRVSVDVVRDGQVVAHLEGRAGGPLGPEALAQVEDAASLARLAAAAAAAAPSSFAPGQTLPFLVALADVPPGLEGAAVRVSADAEGSR